MNEPTWRRIPRGIWALGFVSLLADVASEMVHSLLPVYLLTLGASVALIGLIEGVAEATALIVKVFSGVLSDRLGKRKPLVLLGYALGAASKPLFALAGGAGMVFGARMIDRIGKGIRGAPRDALVADLAPPDLRGAAFGLRQSLDSVGAFIGPLLAIGLMLAWQNDFRAVFWAAAVPGFLAVAVLLFGVREPRAERTTPRVNPISRANLARLGNDYRWVVAIGAAFTLARFSEAFLVLRVQEGGLPLAWVPLVLVAMNVVYAGLAYPFGRLSDRVSRRSEAPAKLGSEVGATQSEPDAKNSHALSHTRLLGAGLVVLMLADFMLAWSNHWTWAWAGITLWGVHMAMTQGLLASMVAGTAPADLRGTAFGVFNLVSGLAMLFASVLAGLLWDSFGAASTFIVGAALAGLALLLLLLRGRIGRARG